MSSAPPVLLLDDGELDRVAAVLRKLGVDFVHLRGPQIGVATRMPRDLLITTLQRAVDPPEYEVPDDRSPAPVRLCVHSQDFLPLRERLRSLGTHFLVHSATDPESLRLLFLQLLHRGAERRGALRVPLGWEVRILLDGEGEKAMLAEVSVDGCRLIVSHEIAADLAITVQVALDSAEEGPLELHGVTLRCTPCEFSPDSEGFAIAVQFRGLEGATRGELDRIVQGCSSTTTVTSLEPLPVAEEVDEDDEPPTPVVNRRRHRRRRYEYPIATLRSLEDDEPSVVLAHDLSSMGARISSCEGLDIGSKIALAIHGNDRREPLILEARVLHERIPGEFGLEFVTKTATQTKQLEEILQQLPYLETLRDDSPDLGRVYVSRLLPGDFDS
jgi:hypothetical protein